MKRLTSFVSLCCLLLLPALASGQTSVTVLGLRANTNDEEAARRVTEALRLAAESASSDEGFQHTGRENDLAQLMIAFGCDDATASCIRQIGEQLSSDRLIYGRVASRSAADGGGYAITLALFDVERAAVERTLREVLPEDMLGEGQIMGPVSRFYAALTGAIVLGELAIHCTVSGATVRVDGQESGTTEGDPIVLRALPPGTVRVSVTHEDHAPWERRVRIQPGRLVEVEVDLGPHDGGTGVTPAGGIEGDEGDEGGEVVAAPLTPEQPRRSLAWLGWTSVGLAAVFAGLAIWSSMEVYNRALTSGGILYEELRCWLPENRTVQAPPAGGSLQWESPTCTQDPVVGESGTPNVFSEIEGHADVAPRTDIGREDLLGELNQAELFETLQFVFYGLSAAAFGVGLYLLISEALDTGTEQATTPDEDEDEWDQGSSVRLSVAPFLWDGGGAVTAVLQF